MSLATDHALVRRGRHLPLLAVVVGIFAGCAHEPHTSATAAVVHGALRAYSDGTPDSPEGAALKEEVAADYARTLPGQPVLVEWALELLAVKERAARDFGCDARSVDVVRFTPSCDALVEGCGRRGVYLWMANVVSTHHAPGFDKRRVALETGAFFPVNQVFEGTKRELERLAPDDDDGDPKLARVCWQAEGDPHGRYTRLADINERAAIDLDCPRNEVFPSFETSARFPKSSHHPRGFAEGCGKRVVYVVDFNSRIVRVDRIEPIETCIEPTCR